MGTKIAINLATFVVHKNRFKDLSSCCLLVYARPWNVKGSGKLATYTASKCRTADIRASWGRGVSMLCIHQDEDVGGDALAAVLGEAMKLAEVDKEVYDYRSPDSFPPTFCF